MLPVLRLWSAKVNYIISTKYPMRPRFEDDEMIVAAYTDLTALKKKWEGLQKELKSL